MQITSEATALGWHERNGGNLSYRLTCEEVEAIRSEIDFNGAVQMLGIDITNLAGEFFVVTASGRYFRRVAQNPLENLGIIRVTEDGKGYQKVWGFDTTNPTSELPTHLLNHSVKLEATGGKHRVILHSHPANTIALTFVLPQDGAAFTRELWEMATECPIVFPKGIGVVPWMVPGGTAIAVATAEIMKTKDVAVWAHHGVFCSGETLDLTFGLMETVEKAAEILVKVISMGGKKRGITTENFIELGKAFGVELDVETLHK